MLAGLRCSNMFAGISLFHLGEYKPSVTALQDTVDYCDDVPDEIESINRILPLKPEDVERVKIYLGKATSKLMFQKRAEAMHKKKLQKVFNPGAKQQPQHGGGDGSNSAEQERDEDETREALEASQPDPTHNDGVVAAPWYNNVFQSVVGLVMYAVGGRSRRASSYK
jgi:hypothetical protein